MCVTAQVCMVGVAMLSMIRFTIGNKPLVSARLKVEGPATVKAPAVSHPTYWRCGLAMAPIYL